MLRKTKKEIAAFLNQISEHNEVVLKTAETRNIIFLGRTRSGKTTAIKVLKDPRSFSENVSLFSDISTDPSLHSFTVERKFQDGTVVNYNINVMETPGLFEMAVIDTHKLKNKLIKATLCKCLEFEISRLHEVYFVCCFEAGVCSQDVQDIIDYIKIFKPLSFHILVTRSENKSTEKRKDLEKQIRLIPELKNFFAASDVKIFFTGALNNNDFNNGALDSIRRNLNNVLEMRKLLYDQIFAADNPCYITELEFYKKDTQNIDELKAVVQSLTDQVQNNKVSTEEKVNLKLDLAKQTEKLKNAILVINRVTGQKDISEYSNVYKASIKAQKEAQ